MCVGGGGVVTYKGEGGHFGEVFLISAICSLLECNVQVFPVARWLRDLQTSGPYALCHPTLPTSEARDSQRQRLTSWCRHIKKCLPTCNCPTHLLINNFSPLGHFHMLLLSLRNSTLILREYERLQRNTAPWCWANTYKPIRTNMKTQLPLQYSLAAMSP